MILAEFLQSTTRRLYHSDTPALDAQVLAAHVLGKDRSWVLAHPEAGLDPTQVDRLEAAAARLEAGEPLPYVTGHWEFFGLDFRLTPDVLIPRPETELLVEQALAWLRARGGVQAAAPAPEAAPSPASPRAIDVGTGSGCIAVSLAVHAPQLHLVATDISPEALDLARQNARDHGVQDRIHFAQADLIPAASPPFDLVCANLPYIPSATLSHLAVHRREPSLALDGGPEGLDQIRRLLDRLPDSLAPRGLALLEIEASQGARVLELARAACPDAQVAILQDLAGRDRLLRLERP